MKYYYTDPLAAAWQAKHFGMEFENDYLCFWTCEGGSEYVLLSHLNQPVIDKFYIHSDSLHLLEPKVGDFIHGLYQPNKLGTLIGQEVLDGCQNSAKAFIAGGVKIIQRNGIAFMWPEMEL